MNELINVTPLMAISLTVLILIAVKLVPIKVWIVISFGVSIAYNLV